VIRCSAVCVANDFELHDRGVGVRVPVVFSVSNLGSTQAPIQWMLGAISPESKEARA
jgi:hypothetical protein